MSGKKPRLDTEGESGPTPLPPLAENAGKTEEHKGPLPYTTPSRVAVEHNYAKLIPFRSSHSAGSRGSSFSTVVLFPDRVSSKVKRKAKKKKVKYSKGKLGGVEEVHSHGEMSTEEGEPSSLPAASDMEPLPAISDPGEAEEILDVTSVDPAVVLPYDEKKVSAIMVECARHVNLVKAPTEIADSETQLALVLSDCDYKQQALLKQLVSILEADKFARLATTACPHEPIKRRLNTNKAAARFRKTLAAVKWEPKLTRWCHETLLRVLDTNLLPVYLDILQVLKAKCHVLVEQMIHSSMNMVGGEAFALLLKRPWNPSVGLYSAEKQVKFDSAPIFVSLPYATTSLGGRRWRMWQSHLSVIGKVFPIILPDSLTDPAQRVPLRELAEQMLVCSFQRVQELSTQYPTRPVVLVGFSLASRIAAKIAEVLPIALIVSLGLPSTGVEHKWKVSSDPFKDCRVPTFFAVGSEGRVSTVAYAEKIRGKMKTPTSLVVVGGGDDLLRLSMADKQLEDISQSIMDRLVLEEIVKFMVHILPCSFNFPEDHHRSQPRKRKAAHAEEIGSTFLTPVLSHSPIILAPSPEDAFDSKNYNFNNSSGFWKSFLKQGGRVSPGGSLSSSPSPIALLEKKFFGENPPPAKRIAAEFLPKQGRLRSNSLADKPKKKTPLRSRSKSSDQTKKTAPPEIASASSTSNTFTPIGFSPEAVAGNSNNNSNISPPSGGMLKIPVPHIRPLPITPPRNPYEDQPIMDRQLDPKTLRHLQLNK